jgi:hypothetical protein
MLKREEGMAEEVFVMDCLYVMLSQVIANCWKRGSIEINFYMGINDEKGKSREDYVELRILYLIWVIGAPYYQEGYIGWVGVVQTTKNLSYHQKLLSGQTYPAR